MLQCVQRAFTVLSPCPAVKSGQMTRQGTCVCRALAVEQCGLAVERSYISSQSQVLQRAYNVLRRGSTMDLKGLQRDYYSAYLRSLA